MNQIIGTTISSENINRTKIILGVIAFIAVSFFVQAMSHFVINVEHFAQVTFMRAEPIMALGLLTMLIQAIVLSYGYAVFNHGDRPIFNALRYSMAMGVFFVSYLTLVEPSKYQVPSVLQWALVEGTAGLIQFLLFGLLLGFIYSRK